MTTRLLTPLAPPAKGAQATRIAAARREGGGVEGWQRLWLGETTGSVDVLPGLDPVTVGAEELVRPQIGPNGGDQLARRGADATGATSVALRSTAATDVIDLQHPPVGVAAPLAGRTEQAEQFCPKRRQALCLSTPGAIRARSLEPISTGRATPESVGRLGLTTIHACSHIAKTNRGV